MELKNAGICDIIELYLDSYADVRPSSVGKYPLITSIYERNVNTHDEKAL